MANSTHLYSAILKNLGIVLLVFTDNVPTFPRLKIFTAVNSILKGNVILEGETLFSPTVQGIDDDEAQAGRSKIIDSAQSLIVVGSAHDLCHFGKNTRLMAQLAQKNTFGLIVSNGKKNELPSFGTAKFLELEKFDASTFADFETLIADFLYEKGFPHGKPKNVFV